MSSPESISNGNPFLLTGAELIAAERQRQITEEGWTAEHDDVHDEGELAAAADCYLTVAQVMVAKKVKIPACFRPRGWPWLLSWWKPNATDPIPNLVKAGALIAAEIDRLQRKEGQQ